MLRGMTGFGKAVAQTEQGRFVVQISSVNRRHLEIRTSLPAVLHPLESDIKQWVSSAISRGQITVTIDVEWTDSPPLTVNLPLLRQLQNISQKVAQELSLEPQYSFNLLVRSQEREMVKIGERSEEAQHYRQTIHDALHQALQPLLTMKDEEGKALQKEIEQRRQLLVNHTESISAVFQGASESYQKKLYERIQEAFSKYPEQEDKLMHAIVSYAEKLDISEEITRLRHHLQHFQQLLQSKEVAVGKSVEFLLQELVREVNTTGSKSADLTITEHVLAMKSELEKIREQIQNVE
jgi:uncharacterized protein (TIGR00255 family)